MPAVLAAVPVAVEVGQGEGAREGKGEEMNEDDRDGVENPAVFWVLAMSAVTAVGAAVVAILRQ